MVSNLKIAHRISFFYNVDSDKRNAWFLNYTAADYVDIMQKLIDKWQIDKITGLTDEAERARDFLMKLPVRMSKISERLIIPVDSYIFKWVQPALK